MATGNEEWEAAQAALAAAVAERDAAQAGWEASTSVLEDQALEKDRLEEENTKMETDRSDGEAKNGTAALAACTEGCRPEKPAAEGDGSDQAQSNG